MIEMKKIVRGNNGGWEQSKVDVGREGGGRRVLCARMVARWNAKREMSR